MNRRILLIGFCVLGAMVLGCESRIAPSSSKPKIIDSDANVRTAVETKFQFGKAFAGKNFDWGPAPTKDIKATKSIFNQPAPELIVETWIGEKPEIDGKFVLIDFWFTWCPRCRRAIPTGSFRAAQLLQGRYCPG